MLEHRHSTLLAAFERTEDLRREAETNAVRRAARAERRRAMREAALRTLTAELQELERRAADAWNSRKTARHAAAYERLRQLR